MAEFISRSTPWSTTARRQRRSRSGWPNRAPKGRTSRVRNSLIVALLGSAATPALAQNARYSNPVPPVPARVVIVVPGKEYAAGSLHRLILGTQYRELWATPIEVPVLDLEHFAGGLKPEKRSGSRQTVGLRFKAADGLEYNF